MSWLDGLAEHLANLGAADLVWSPNRPYRERDVGIVLEEIPTTPVELVCLTGYEGARAISIGGTDDPRLQVRTRSVSRATSRDRCQAIYDDLHGLGPTTLPDGTEVQLVIGRGSGPAYIGQDAAGNHEHTANYDVSIYNPNRRGRSK